MINRITNKPPRLHEDDAIYFVTFCTFEKKPLLHLPGIPEMLIENLSFYAKRLRELIAFTIMPDHVHILAEVERSVDLSNFLRDFKKYTSKEIKRSCNEQGAHVWQRGSFDHCIRFSKDGRDLANHLNYVFFNSWKHLHIAPKDFPYHNFHSLVEQGFFEEDFCSFDEKNLENDEYCE